MCPEACKIRNCGDVFRKTVSSKWNKDVLLSSPCGAYLDLVTESGCFFSNTINRGTNMFVTLIQGSHMHVFLGSNRLDALQRSGLWIMKPPTTLKKRKRGSRKRWTGWLREWGDGRKNPPYLLIAQLHFHEEVQFPFALVICLDMQGAVMQRPRHTCCLTDQN